MTEEAGAHQEAGINERRFESAAHALSGFAAGEFNRIGLLLRGLEVLIESPRSSGNAELLAAHVNTVRELAERAAADVQQIANTVGIRPD